MTPPWPACRAPGGVPAASGSGKTLLAARLVSMGCTYLSDEAALLLRDGSMQPVPTRRPMPPLQGAPLTLVFPRYVAGAPATLRLMGQCLAIPQRLTADAAGIIVDALERASCWELVGGDLDGAA